MAKAQLDLQTKDMSLAEQFSLLPEEEQTAYLNDLYEKAEHEYGKGSVGIEQFLKNWEFWGRPEQQLPKHDKWDILLCLAGRGSGKTRLAAEAVHEKALNKNWHISLVGETVAEVRDVMIEGPSGLKATQKPWNPILYTPSQRKVEWLESGTTATTYSGDRPDQLRGPNSHFAWRDELAKYRYPDLMWENLDMVLRAGETPQCIVSTTPRPIPLIKSLVKRALSDPYVIVRRWSTYRNIANLAPRYITRMLQQYEGTRIGRQELYAEILEDTEGALWTLRKIDELRISYRPYMEMIAVGVDPPTSTGGECGIVVMGLAKDELYCMADMTCQGLPEEWGAKVVAAYHAWDADIVVPEKNQGGDMVMSTIRTIDPMIPMAPVWASRGKRTRAEPISTYTERGSIHHIGSFGSLEDELTGWIPGDESPNRLDAYVHAATYLLNHTQYGAKSKRARAI